MKNRTIAKVESTTLLSLNWKWNTCIKILSFGHLLARTGLRKLNDCNLG